MPSLSLKAKLGLIAFLSTVGMLALTAVQYLSLRAMDSAHEMRVLISGIESGMLTLRRHEKDFLARNDLKYREKFLGSFDRIQSQVNSLVGQLQGKEIDAATGHQLRSALEAYKDKFLVLVTLRQQIGLHHEDGLYGSLRKAVHQAEELFKALEQDRLSKDMLMLRRREKDFMLRHEPKYVADFDKDMSILQGDLKRAGLGQESIDKIHSALALYEQDFKALVAAEERMGFSSNQGIQGDMRGTIQQTEDMLEQLAKIAHQAARNTQAGAQSLSVLMTMVMVVCILLLILLLARRINQSISGLSQLMGQASRDNDLSLRAQVAGKDEVSAIGLAFNGMMDRFGETIGNVIASIATVGASGAKQSRLVEAITQGARQQHGDIDQVATAMNEMSATVQEVARNTNQAAMAANMVMEQAHDGQKVVTKAIKAMETLRTRVEQAARVIGELEARSSEISRVLEVISGISEQTNLLALNAAIEAARAGEQGRGFAVVADEVRALAGRTKSSANEINVMIASLQRQVREAVSVMETSQVDALASSQEAESTGRALAQILGEIGGINDMVTQIATAAEQQSAVAEEMNRNVTSISTEASNTAEYSSETLRATSDIGKDLDALRSAVAHFKLGKVAVRQRGPN